MDTHSIINTLHGVGGYFIPLAAGLFIACLAYTLIRKRQNKNADRNDSLGILKNRLAAGEISLDEFNTIKQVL